MIRPTTHSKNQPTQPGIKRTRSMDWNPMKRLRVQLQKEDATQGVDKDPSIKLTRYGGEGAMRLFQKYFDQSCVKCWSTWVLSVFFCTSKI
jgi:hypothetical protein